ncbi:MAG TPA: DISARM system phospholipase D-like protein DrmC [Gemmataceae bacterium]|jgi:phosphatidylserine/phosphatidylglycerophosphate/cardiolipin synthase-like enzyme
MNASLLLLTESDLPPLIAGLRSGRLTAPFTPALIEHLIGHPISLATIQAMVEFQQLGFSEAQLAAALELVLQDRQRRPRLEDAIDLVMSGPEGQGVANRDTRVVVRELFANARKSVLVAGYAVYQGKSVFQALADRMMELPELKVRVILDIRRGPGDTTLASLLVRRFAERFRTTQWPQDRPLPEVYYDPRSLDVSTHERSAMHAKCIVVDKHNLFVSSANFTEAAQNRNLEVGILLRSVPLASNLASHFDALVGQRLLLPVW